MQELGFFIFKLLRKDTFYKCARYQSTTGSSSSTLVPHSPSQPSQYYCDAAGELYDRFAEWGCTMHGFTSTEGYAFAKSKAERDGQFVGRMFDQKNQAELSADRAVSGPRALDTETWNKHSRRGGRTPRLLRWFGWSRRRPPALLPPMCPRVDGILGPPRERGGAEEAAAPTVLSDHWLHWPELSRAKLYFGTSHRSGTSVESSLEKSYCTTIHTIPDFVNIFFLKRRGTPKYLGEVL